MASPFFARILAASSVLALSACGYALEKSSQNIKFLTPGAENAYCDVYVDKLRYQVLPPQTMNISKSSKDMIIKCHAPGNRRVEMEVPASVSAAAVWGAPAYAWDYAANASHLYPSVIAIDFTKTVATPNAAPKYSDPALDSSNPQDLEEITPSVPRLNADKYKTVPPLERRESANQAAPAIDGYHAPVKEGEGDKGSLMSIIDRLNTQGEGNNAAADIEGPSPRELPAGEQPVTIFTE